MSLFDRLFATLIRRWTRYQDAPRDPNNLTELSEARLALDETRSEIADARATLAASSDPLPSGRPPERIAVDQDDLKRLRVQGTIPEG